MPPMAFGRKRKEAAPQQQSAPQSASQPGTPWQSYSGSGGYTVTELPYYDKGKRKQWDAAERIDWSHDPDLENPLQIPDELAALMDNVAVVVEEGRADGPLLGLSGSSSKSRAGIDFVEDQSLARLIGRRERLEVVRAGREERPAVADRDRRPEPRAVHLRGHRHGGPGSAAGPPSCLMTRWSRPGISSRMLSRSSWASFAAQTSCGRSPTLTGRTLPST